MCKVLEVSRSGFYAWIRRQESARAREDRKLLAEIRRIHEASRKTYGAPRVHAELRRRGWVCGLNRVARLMRENGIRSKVYRRFRVRTTDSNHSLPVAANVVAREFTAEAPDRLWVADITYIPTGEGWLYLASIVDVFSRKVVGWAMDSHMRAPLVLAALDMALRERRPGRDLVHHSDRGSQYASKAYRNALAAHGITCSMSSKGNCYDNALKEELLPYPEGRACPRRELCDEGGCEVGHLRIPDGLLQPREAALGAGVHDAGGVRSQIHRSCLTEDVLAICEGTGADRGVCSLHPHVLQLAPRWRLDPWEIQSRSRSWPTPPPPGGSAPGPPRCA